MPTLTARYVFPVSGPPLPNGLLTYEGDKIVAVEPAGTRTADLDLGNVAILPGFVNAHTHLDLSGARGLIPPTDPDHFTDWLKGVIAYRRTRTPEQVQHDIRNGLNEVLKSGTTLVGDITSGGASYSIVSGKAGGLCPPVSGSQGDTVPPLSGLRSVMFWELIGLTKQRLDQSLKEMREHWNRHESTDLCLRNLSPHAPYSVHKDALTCQDRMSNPAIHLAESPAEVELLESCRGPMVEFLQDLGVWDGAEFASFESILKRRVGRVILVHCNHLPIQYWSCLGDRHTIVYCPRTHAAFGHPPHPFRDFLARGVRVCLGTDSLASNPDLDILAEARFVRSRHPDFPGSQLLTMITLAGAEALGWADECGSLEPGKSADLVVVPLPDRDEPDPHDLFLKDDSPPAARRTLFRGQWR
jgi:cytosine/adenosine deaminase-related metal-dependent hydrolase